MEALDPLIDYRSSFPQMSSFLFELFKLKLVADVTEWDYNNNLWALWSMMKLGLFYSLLIT
jgi:hypothetical protein